MQKILEKASNIRLLISDVDGVLTDGSLLINDAGDTSRSFNVIDGIGLKILMRTGVEVAIITGGTSPHIKKRMDYLEIKHVYLACEHKIVPYEDLLNKLNLSPLQVAYIGDDLPDLPLIQRSGLGIAVKNAVDIVREYADWETEKMGGQGAVREVCELIMKAQNTLNQAIDFYQ